jgi:transcriptional regulator with XRE-family HTH domain
MEGEATTAMNLEQFFAEKTKENPALAEEFAQAEAEMRLALQATEQRERQGLTQRQLAMQLGVSQSVVGRFERAGRTPGVDTLWRLATALNVHFDIGPNYSVHVFPHINATSLAELSGPVDTSSTRRAATREPRVRPRTRAGS